MAIELTRAHSMALTNFEMAVDQQDSGDWDWLPERTPLETAVRAYRDNVGDTADEQGYPGWERKEALRFYDALAEANEGAVAAMGFRAVIPIHTLTDQEIMTFPRAAFTQEEFDERDSELQEAIHRRDPQSWERINGMVRSIRARVGWVEDNDTGMAEEEFADALSNTPDQEILDKVEDPDEVIDSLYGTYELVLSKARVNEVLLEHLKDMDYYTREIEDAQTGGSYPFKIDIRRELYLDRGDIDGLEFAYPDEISTAIDLLEDDYDVSSVLEEAGLDAKALIEMQASKWGEFQAELDPSYALIYTPNWDNIKEWVDEALAEEMPDEPLPSDDPRTYGERKLYTFEDGAYWVELTTEDLPGESEALGHCVGQLEHGYPQAVDRKDMKVFSLRTPGGRSKLTAAFHIDEDGEVEKVAEISGKGNRRPGWPAGKTGEGKVKWMEVQKVGKLLELLGFSEEGMRGLGELASAHRAMDELYKETGQPIPLTQNPGHCPFCRRN
jgi:hypothetical protein